MTGYKKVFVDTAPFIYFIEGSQDNPLYHDKVKNFLNDCYNNNIQFVTSVVTIEEYFAYPYRIDAPKYIDLFEKLIQTLNFKVVEIDKTIAKNAAKIRAEYKAFKSMDALQIATAVLNECDLLLTNDKQLKQFKEIKCITIDDLSYKQV